MKHIDADLLRKEIEQLRREVDDHNYYLDNSEQAVGYGLALDDIEKFLDTLSEEPDKSLEEEYKDYVENDPVYSKLVNRNAGLGIARHFAEWQKKQDLAEMAQSKSPLSVAYTNRCFENGKQAMKEDMLKGAVKGEVYKFGEVSYVKERNNAELTKYLSQFNNGDKVCIVVLKEEE